MVYAKMPEHSSHSTVRLVATSLTIILCTSYTINRNHLKKECLHVTHFYGVNFTVLAITLYNIPQKMFSHSNKRIIIVSVC